LDLEPLNFEGNRELDNPEASYGCHGGDSAGLNIWNPQEGFVYSWANDNPRDRLLVRQRGGQIVQGDDSEMAAYQQMVGHTQTDLDSAQTGYPGVILVRTPIEIERRRREEEGRRRRALLRGGGAETAFMQSGLRDPEEAAAAASAGRTGLRFARKDHGTRVTAGPGEEAPVVDHWVPGDGISRDT
jgi:hypothetical protein